MDEVNKDSDVIDNDDYNDDDSYYYDYWDFLHFS